MTTKRQNGCVHTGEGNYPYSIPSFVGSVTNKSAMITDNFVFLEQCTEISQVGHHPIEATTSTHQLQEPLRVDKAKVSVRLALT